MDELEKNLQNYKLAAKAMVVFRRAERTVRSYEGDTIRKYNLTSMQFGVMEVLYSKGDLRISDLIDKMLSTSGNMTVVIKNMERDGYINRMSDPADKRSSIISLTDKGRSLIEKILPEHFRHLSDIFSVLTEDDQKELIRILNKFKNLKL